MLISAVPGTFYDRNNCLNRLNELIPEAATDCIAQALMSNLSHLGNSEQAWQNVDYVYGLFLNKKPGTV